MKIFGISDTHFGHEAIIKYCNRPFSNVEEMDRAMIKRWNETVSNNDIVIHLGDFALCSKERIKEITKQLNGKKILIMGNHDNYNEQFYRDVGFHTVSRFPILYNSWYFCSHAPLQMFQDCCYKNLYGHVHNDPVYQDTPNAECLCVERIGYRPKLLFEKN